MSRVIKATYIQTIDQRILRFCSNPRRSFNERRLNCKQVRLPPLPSRHLHSHKHLQKSVSFPEAQQVPQSSQQTQAKQEFSKLLKTLVFKQGLNKHVNQFNLWRTSIQNGLKSLQRARAQQTATEQVRAVLHRFSAVAAVSQLENRQQHREWLDTLRKNKQLKATREASVLRLQRWVRGYLRRQKFKQCRVYLKALTYDSRLYFFKYQLI